MTNLFYLLRYFKNYKGLIFITLFALILSRVAATIQPLYLKKIIDFLTARLTDGSTTDTVVSLLIIYFSYSAAVFIFEFIRDYAFAPVEMGIGKKISQDVFDHLLRLPINFHHNQKTGALARRISRGAQSINFILDFLVINILPTIFELIFVTILLLRLYAPQYGLITLITIVFYAIFTIFTTELRQKYRLAANLAEDESSAVQVETITNVDTVKYFGNEDFQQKKFAAKINLWYQLSIRSNQLFAAIAAGQSAILLVGFGLLVYLGVRDTLLSKLTVGDLVLLTSYILRLAAPIGVLGFVYRRLKDGLTDLSSMANIFTQPIELQDDPAAKNIRQIRGEVAFSNLTFHYGRREALRQLNLTIPAGKRVAIVGPSGAGKSTITKLLFRLYDPQKGQVLIDGTDLRKIKSRQRHQLIALVPQETLLFNDTIGQNILFGKPNATQKELNDAVKLAQLEELIARLPDGLQTVVGERGVKLSGGEKQRVAIARAIIKNPKILVFDEATSNLDATAEREIIQAIRQVSKGRTTIVIAHRLPTITDSDLIFVIDKGGLAEAGTHQELLAKNGVYAKLWKNFI